MVRRSVADHSYGRATIAWSVEFREVNALPRAEHELAVAYRERDVASHEHRFDVRGKRRHRSEEHTSELQSQFHIVCRLLLEKKKKTKTQLLLAKRKNKNIRTISSKNSS